MANDSAHPVFCDCDECPLGWKTLLFVVALALFACFGCAAPVSEAESPETIALDGEIRVSDDFLAVERAEIDAAVAEWYRATGGSFRFSLVSSPNDAPWSIERREINDCGESGIARGCARTAQRLIELDPWRIYPVGSVGFPLDEFGDFRGVTLHELGHAIGLGHDAGLLMEPERETANCIDLASLETACALRGCAEMRPTCE